MANASRARCRGQIESQRNSIHLAEISCRMQWWKWSRCGHSDAQRSVWASVPFASLMRGECLTCPLSRADRVAAQLYPPNQAFVPNVVVEMIALRPFRRLRNVWASVPFASLMHGEHLTCPLSRADRVAAQLYPPTRAFVPNVVVEMVALRPFRRPAKRVGVGSVREPTANE